jgi:hypothetical protein
MSEDGDEVLKWRNLTLGLEYFEMLRRTSIHRVVPEFDRAIKSDFFVAF